MRPGTSPDRRPELSNRRSTKTAERFVFLDHGGFPTDADWERRRRETDLTGPDRWRAFISSKELRSWLGHLVDEHIATALRAVRYLRHIAVVHEERIIRRARAAGVSWEDIGYWLGVSRQAVHQRWSKRLAREEQAIHHPESPELFPRQRT